MKLHWCVFLLGFVCAFANLCCAQATVVADDPAFKTVPFEKWIAEGDQGKFRLNARITAGELSNHHRLKTKIDLQVDGNDLTSRRGHGFLVMLAQFEDSDHRLYRSHGVLDLQQVTEAAAKSDFVFTQEAFVRPGDYTVSLVVFDTQTGEHSALQRKTHTNPLRNDPFPAAWEHLPAVEFIGTGDAPDIWYLPLIEGKPELSLKSRRPLDIEVFVNASPAATNNAQRSGQIDSRSLGVLLPALKVISQVKVANGKTSVTLLDLTRQKILFEQTLARDGGLEWAPLRASLIEADPNKIDARSLAQRRGNAQFFIAQVKQRLAPEAAPRPDSASTIGIVLSGPMGFESGEDRHPIEGTSIPPGWLFYVRYHGEVPVLPDPLADFQRNGRRGIGVPMPPQPVFREPVDGMVNLIKPLQPRVFDVYTPEQFRKALSTILDELSKL